MSEPHPSVGKIFFDLPPTTVTDEPEQYTSRWHHDENEFESSESLPHSLDEQQPIDSSKNNEDLNFKQNKTTFFVFNFGF